MLFLSCNIFIQAIVNIARKCITQAMKQPQFLFYYISRLVLLSLTVFIFPFYLDADERPVPEALIKILPFYLTFLRQFQSPGYVLLFSQPFLFPNDN